MIKKYNARGTIESPIRVVASQTTVAAVKRRHDIMLYYNNIRCMSCVCVCTLNTNV